MSQVSSSIPALAAGEIRPASSITSDFSLVQPALLEIPGLRRTASVDAHSRIFLAVFSQCSSSGMSRIVDQAILFDTSRIEGWTYSTFASSLNHGDTGPRSRLGAVARDLQPWAISLVCLA